MGPLNIGDGLFSDTPRGEDLPIGKTYPYPQDDLPEGFTAEWIRADDPQLEEAGFTPVHIYVTEDGRGVFEPPHPDAVPASFGYLRNPVGKLVATWDEGRWWTPEESEAFHLMLRVPGVSAIDAYGLGTDTPKGGIEWPE